ncbi:hypothetical protein Pst134EA_018956 [Puccinia striiformis f. sp. tritici]|uniref:hypothetical protein n=1 Tax=Puccinia striiformis f. sp. tritici TaxID=168172 RepID=UPI002008878A|nr:hypothetical protein Pst134EA_018956 [Puccinia striiformis f. sp. tritici]KAH9458800.1 hypothetical protein Pst134EA_018956 [Puccinia striiformis f. sp. tritici]
MAFKSHTSSYSFSITGSAKHRVLWECLAGWAARLTETGTAHVVFTSENSGALKPLGQAFSTRPVKSIVLTDASIDRRVDNGTTSI